MQSMKLVFLYYMWVVRARTHVYGEKSEKAVYTLAISVPVTSGT